jgi:RND family efflux transporter MFP subunit
MIIKINFKNWFMKNAILYFMIFSILGLAAAGCDEKGKAKTTKDEDAVVVRTTPVSVFAYSPELTYSGTIASTSEAKLSFKIGGMISRVYVKEGDHVAKGQLLASLDLTEINAQVEQATQNAEKTNRDFNRMKSLFEDTAATLEQYQNVQTQQNVAKENLRIAAFNRQYAQIKAAYAGTITRKIMNEGEYASSGSPVLIMNGTAGNDWVMRFGVTDRDWVLLQKGNIATVHIDAYPDKPFSGRISKIAEAADALSGTYETEVQIFPDGRKLAPGLFATIHIQAKAAQKINRIPIEALAEADGKTGYVYALNSDKKTVSRYKVRIAFIDKDSVALSSGLETVHEVITDGLSYLTEHSKVKPIQ